MDLDDIFFSTFKNGEYSIPQNLVAPMNSELHESTPFIDPNGDYLLSVMLIDSKDCILISLFNQKRGWETPFDLTEKYPPFYGTCPRLSPDGKYILINRYKNREANVYWVSANIITQID